MKALRTAAILSLLFFAGMGTLFYTVAMPKMNAAIEEDMIREGKDPSTRSTGFVDTVKAFMTPRGNKGKKRSSDISINRGGGDKTSGARTITVPQ